MQPYDEPAKRWLDRSDHYLQNASTGAFFAVAVRPLIDGLFPGIKVPDETTLLGLCVVGRPVSPKLPQDGTWGEVTRMFLVPGLPYGLASEVLRMAMHAMRERPGAKRLIAYHDRSRHTGCIYRKAGFRRNGTSDGPEGGWGSRPGRKSAGLPKTKKRRWAVELSS